MKNLNLSITINRSAHEAFTFTLNPDNTPKWIDGIVKEEANETPTKLGTIYRNQGRDDSWREFEVTAYNPSVMFVWTEKGSDMHVKYTFKPLGDKRCELEYCVWLDSGELQEPFTRDNLQAILQKLKRVMEQE
ncbi:MAG TPA: SRPBCC family protein [Candidatus Saccharimonadales bacterium]|nr:SRPBCC family protein [Candidatus Saccharimonadales bacterium]